MMEEETLKLKTRHLALEAIRLARSLPPYSTAREIGQEFVRSATAVGTTYRAACQARSHSERIAKLSQVAEHADKCLYWMELLLETEGVPAAELKDLMSDTRDIWALSLASTREPSTHKFSQIFTQYSTKTVNSKFFNGLTPLSILLSFFPVFVMLMTVFSAISICENPGLTPLLSLIFTLYGFPLITYRIHQRFYPVKEGITYLRRPEYSPWWGSHQIQLIYIAFPTLEALLRLIPGAFSVWLRLWGSKIGRGVYWTTHVEIADRGFIEIGDRVTIGHRVGLSSHIIKPKHNDLRLYVKRLKIGNDVFVGSGSHLGPGVTIADGAYLPISTDLYANTQFPKNSSHD